LRPSLGKPERWRAGATAVNDCAVLDGASREEAARIGCVGRQTLRDWVIRLNEQGADGLINIPSPGAPPQLNARHKAFLARLVEAGGPIPATHGVARWRACDLIMQMHEAFGLLLSDHTIYRAGWASGM
jgi:transposase